VALRNRDIMKSVKKNHVRKNRALLLLTRHMRKERREANKDEVQKQSERVRRVAKRITQSPWIRIDV